MGELQLGDRRVDTDMRLWDPDTRRWASLIVLGTAAVLLIGSLLYFGIDATGSGWFMVVAIVLLAILMLFELAVIATGYAREEGGPAWLAGPDAPGATVGATAGATTGGAAGGGAVHEPPAQEPEPERHVDLRCPSCTEMFSVHDTGERPLHTQCPHCGAEGHVDLGPPPEEPAQEPAREAAGAAGAGTAAGTEAAEAEAEEERELVGTISLKCPACDTQFDVDDYGDRPLATTCPGCGRSGKLR